MTRLLIVEDDRALRVGLEDTFRDEGHDVTTAADGDEAYDVLFRRHFDLVILDLMLPGRSGLEILRELREQKVETPVLLLTARGDESDKVIGLELGADDYVTKPFGMRELIARVRVLLRRHGKTTQKAAQPDGQTFSVGDATVDLSVFEIAHGSDTHRLSPKEASMLLLLYQAKGSVVRRETFLDEIWGTDQFVGTRTVDTHMLNLRQKLEPNPKEPRFLLTVHGVGYRLSLDGSAPS